MKRFTSHHLVLILHLNTNVFLFVFHFQSSSKTSVNYKRSGSQKVRFVFYGFVFVFFLTKLKFGTKVVSNKCVALLVLFLNGKLGCEVLQLKIKD